MRNLAGEFTISKWDEDSFLDLKGAAKANHAHILHTVRGDLNGEFEGKYVMIYNDDTQGRYSGALQFRGKVGKHTGTFFLQELGIFEGELASSTWEVIDGSGTDDFKSITGTGSYQATGKTVSFTLELEGI